MVATTVDGFLGTERHDSGVFSFGLGAHLHGAFGGTFGGAVAACTLRVARDLAPHRIPVSLDVRFLRGLTGAGIAEGSVLHEGRSLTTVAVDVRDGNGRPAAQATIGLVAPGALHPLERPAVAPPALEWDGARRWQAPGGMEIPIVSTLAPRVVGVGESGVATGLSVPWEGADDGAEAVCMAADMCVGPPVAAAFDGRWLPHPNPDLSLRFAGVQPSGGPLVGVGRLEGIATGVALVRIGVWRGGELAGVGVSCSLLLGTTDRGGEGKEG